MSYNESKIFRRRSQPAGRRLSRAGVVLLFLVLATACSRQPQPNTLTRAELADGWQLLFDGQSTKHWRGIYLDRFPATGWIIEDGALVCLGSQLPREQRGGSIITVDQYSSFEFSLEFKIQENANSGIKYFVSEDWPEDVKRPGHGLGLEYAILDDANWPYDQPDYHRTTGSLYDFVTAAAPEVQRPLGQWNQARIVVRNGLIQHYLNGVRVVALERGSEAFMALYAKSKYKDLEGFGLHPQGHILLQDEGPPAAFRNIKLRVF